MIASSQTLLAIMYALAGFLSTKQSKVPFVKIKYISLEIAT